MGAVRRFLRRLQNAILPRRGERELARELDAHLALLEEAYRARGLAPDDARRAARVAMGGVEPAKDRHRDARSFVWLDDVRRDTAYAFRTLMRSPAFAAVAILTLALTIGANTAIVTIVDHVLVRSLPLPDADRLVRLYESNASAGRIRESASPPHVIAWRQMSTTIGPITAMGGTSVTLTGAAESESVTAMLVGADFFALSGVRPLLGRPFEPAEYQSTANATLGPLALRDDAEPTGRASVIISHALWQRQFGSDDHVVGRAVALNGVPAVVSGVMPAGVWFDQSPWGQADCWLPAVESKMPRRFRQYTAIGRLKPGVTLQAAQADMTRVAALLAQQFPADDAGWTVEVEPLQESVVREARPTLWILLGGVTCVLLIACASIANLLLMRSLGRTREVAIRMAIGAGRSRLIRQWLTESTVIAVCGGLLGYLLAAWAVLALATHAPLSVPHLDQVTVDARVFAINLTISLATGLLCGLAPALGTRGVNVANLRTAGVAGGSRRRRWLRPALVIIQVGLAIVLLVAAGLVGRTLIAVQRLDLGFDPNHVLTFGVSLRGDRYRMIDNARAFSRDLIARVEQLPGVEAIGSGMVPLVGGTSEDFAAEGHQGLIESRIDTISTGYLPALRFHLRAGRYFTGQDTAGSEPVAIVSERFAHEAWGASDESVVGRHIRTGADGKTPWMTVVGLTNDVRATNLEDAPPARVFLPTVQNSSILSGNYVVRTSGDPHDSLPAIRQAVAAIDPGLAVTRIATMDERIAKFMAPRQFNVWLIGVFSGLALILAVVGIYGLISESVTSRTTEIGVRMALGARRSSVVRLVAGGTVTVLIVGVVIGLGAAAATARSLGAMLYGVAPIDPLTLLTVPIVFVAVAALAAFAPARRATRVDPVIALRSDV